MVHPRVIQDTWFHDFPPPQKKKVHMRSPLPILASVTKLRIYSQSVKRERGGGVSRIFSMG